MATIYCCCNESGKDKCNDEQCDKHAKTHPAHTGRTCWPKNKSKVGETNGSKTLQ